MAVTIKDVAREAGLSVASVSRALNGHSSVTVETRQHIEGVAKRLNYIPHSGARSLITRRTQTVGVLLPDIHGEFFSEIVRGIDSAARSRGMHLLVSSSHGDAAGTAAAFRSMSGRVDGILVMSPHVDEDFIADNLPGRLPLVLLNTRVRGERMAALNVDNFAGARDMTQHLIAGGHRHIVFLSGPIGNFDSQERLRGYRAALAGHGMESSARIVEGDFTEESGYRAGRAMLASQPLPDAVFAANDIMAIGCLFALHEAGLLVPRDVALAGFDDIPMARFITPPLSTVRIHIDELGRRALERLVAMIEGGAEAASGRETLVPELVVRASSTAHATKVYEKPPPARRRAGGR